MNKKNAQKQTRRTSDNLCKFLAEKYPDQIVEWLFGIKNKHLKILKTEMQRESIRADSAILFEAENTILHVEFQTIIKSVPPMPLRMLDYYIGFKRKFPDKKIKQVLVVLKNTGENVPARYEEERWFFVYDVVKMWEQSPRTLMKHKGLLSLASLCRTRSDGEKL